MLLVLAEMGIIKQMLLVLLEMSGTSLSVEQKRFLLGPIIQHKSAWQDTTPKWIYEAVTFDRMQILFEEIESGESHNRVGPIELMAVIYPATMEAPLSDTY